MADETVLQTLLAHDRWATEQLLIACATLDDQKLDQGFAMGRGSLRATMIHIVDVIRGWHDAMIGRPERPDTDAKTSIESLRELHRSVADEFEKTCTTRPASEVLTMSRGPRTMTAPLGALATHVLTHGTHHRAQALNMLRQLSVDPLPQSSVLSWMIATGVAKVKVEGK